MPRFIAGVLVALVSAVASCTPIDEVTKGRKPVANGGSDASTVATADRPTGDSRNSVGSFEGMPCDREGARICAPGNPSRLPLECSAGQWQSRAECSKDQRCEVAGGPELGTCVAIESECAGRSIGQEFCNGKEIHVCTSEGNTDTVRPCAENEMCTTAGGAADCVCRIGFVLVGGECVRSTTCDPGAAACDSLSTCTLVDNKPVCGACPESFTQTADSGCVPLLGQLVLAAGATLTPAYSPDVTSYRVQLPLVVPNVQMTLKGPAEAQIQVNGMPLDASGQWTSPVLPLGTHPIQITLTSTSGTLNKYDLVVERAGKQDAYVKARIPEAEDCFGYMVAMAGDTLAVGAPCEDSAAGGVNGDESNNSASNSGAVYVFVRDAAGWTQQAYIKADDPTAYAWFGKSIAIEGDTLVIGEARASPFTNTPVAARAGSFYVFTRSAGTWTRTAVVRPDDVQEGDLFSYDVALSNGTLVIGSPFESSGGHHSGAAYVASSADGFTKLVKLKAQVPQAEDVFGWSVAVDNKTVVVSALQFLDPSSRTGPGRVYVFAEENGQWVEKQILVGPNTEVAAAFGFGIAVLGDRIAVGAPRPRLNTVAVPSGQTFVFDRVAGSFELSATLTATNPRQSDYFGSSVALAPNGVLVCAQGNSSGGRGLDGDDSRSDSFQSGAFYLFGRDSEGWKPSVFGKPDNAEASDQFGYICRISGTDLVVSSALEGSGVPTNGNDNSADGAGAVYMFR